MSILELDFNEEINNVASNPDLVDKKIKQKIKFAEFWFLIAIVVNFGLGMLFLTRGAEVGWKIGLSILTVISVLLYLHCAFRFFAWFFYKKSIKLIREGNNDLGLKSYKKYKFFSFDWTSLKKHKSNVK